jgi:hypothetical protein
MKKIGETQGEQKGRNRRRGERGREVIGGIWNEGSGRMWGKGR